MLRYPEVSECVAVMCAAAGMLAVYEPQKVKDEAQVVVSPRSSQRYREIVFWPSPKALALGASATQNREVAAPSILLWRRSRQYDEYTMNMYIGSQGLRVAHLSSPVRCREIAVRAIFQWI